MYTKWTTVIPCVAMLALIAATALAQTDARRSAQRMIFDQTHEFLFAVDHMGYALFQRGYNVTICRDTFPTADLDQFDVALVHQSSVAVEVDEPMVRRLREFVRKGGGLYLMANYPHFLKYSRKKDVFPIAKLTTVFGIHPDANPGKPPVTTVPGNGFGPVFEIERRFEAFPVGTFTFRQPKGKDAPRNFRVLAKDAEGHSAVATLEYGKGRVVVVTEMSLLGKPDKQEQLEFQVKLFDWLARINEVSRPPANPQPQFVYREPQLQLERNGVVVRYPKPLQEGAVYLLDSYERFYKVLWDFFQSGPTGHLRLEALATGGGAFTARPLIAMGVLTSKEGIDGFILWEMTNAWYLPQAPSFTEAWATFVHEELGPKVGAMTAEQAAKNIARQEEILRADDPHLDKFDVSLLRPDEVMPGKPKLDRDWGHYRMLKCGYILRQLYNKYGIEMFRRLIRIHRAQYGKSTDTPDFDSYVRELSLAAGEDLTEFFRRYGATVGKLNLPATKEEIEAEAQQLIAKDQAAEGG